MAASDDEPEFTNFPDIDAARFAAIVSPGSFIFAEPEDMNMKLVSRVEDCINLPMMVPNPSKMASDSRIVTDNPVPKMESVEEVTSHPPPINPIIENPDLSFKSTGKLSHPEKRPASHLYQMGSEGAGASTQEASPRKTQFKTNLKLLIEKGVISDMEELRYLSKKDKGTVMGTGKATTEGVLCDCCGEVLTLSKFEAHAKSNCRRPAENIFLADGRSLQECYLEAMMGTAEKDQLAVSPTPRK